MNLTFLSFSEIINKFSDERVNRYPFMSSPIIPLITVLGYIAFVFRIGPSLMKNRPSFQIDKLVRVYNIIQVFLNAVLFIKCIGHFSRMSFHCSPWDPSSSKESLDMIWIHYFYTMLKFFDLVDTVFFVLRKKNKQISFLHVYHHIMVIFSSWLSCKFLPGGLSYYLILLNSFVHAVMYYYYYLANMNSKDIWWKKYITMMQLGQNFIGFYAVVAHLFNKKCSFSKVLTFWYFLNGSLLIALFLRFYFASYLKKKKRKPNDDNK